MREILFRGKRNDSGEWVEGNLLKSDESYYIVPYFGVNSIEDIICCVCDKLIILHAFEIDPETVCQYTEAIAIGGKKIFEHDIVENDGTIGIVKFGKYRNGFHLSYYIDWITCPLLRNELCYWESKVKVIGNILDNPELIGGANNE